MLNQNEFKERIQLLLTEATVLAKKQQCLIEFNKLCLMHKTEIYLKYMINIFENIKKQHFQEIELKALKIMIQNYKEYIDEMKVIKISNLINKGFSEGNDLSYNLCSECYFLLSNDSNVFEIAKILIPLALKLNSLVIQTGATISLLGVINSVEQIPLEIKRSIITFYTKNLSVVHQSMGEILIKIVDKKDKNLIQIVQRSLMVLQDQKHTYQIKQSICRLLENISKFEFDFQEQLILQCITVLRELTFDRIQSLSQAAKSALQSYQNIYITNNPTIVTSSYFPDIKPILKKKRGDNHIFIDADKYKKQQYQSSQLKQQLNDLQQQQKCQLINNSLLDEKLQNDRKQELQQQSQSQQQQQQQQPQQKQKQQQQQNQEEDQDEDIQEDIVNSQDHEDGQDLQKTQLFLDQDQLEETRNFNDQSTDIYAEVLDLLQDEEVDKSFQLLLDNEDDIYLLRLMMTVDNYFSQLSQKTAERLIQRFSKIYQSKFVDQVFKQILNQSLKNPQRDTLKVGQLNELIQLQNNYNKLQQ